MYQFLSGAILGFLSGIGLASIFWLSIGLRLFKKLPPKPPTLLPAMLWAIVAGVMFLCAIRTGIYSTYFLLASQPTTATVLEIREKKDSDGHYSSFPVYRYTDSSGIEHRDTSSVSDGRPMAVGDIIPIRYLRNYPAESRIDYFGYHWLLPLFLAGGSPVALAISFALRWNYRRLTQAAK